MKRRSKLGVLGLWGIAFSADWSLLVGCLVGPLAQGLGGLTVTISLHPDPRERRPGLSLTPLPVFLCTHTGATSPATFPGGHPHSAASAAGPRLECTPSLSPTLVLPAPSLSLDISFALPALSA